MKPLVILTRSGRMESVHCGYVCVTGHGSETVYSIGEPETRIYLRSSAKPLQAVALAASGALEKFGITESELAIICSSHSGEDFHRKAVSSILAKAGLNENHLDCGSANPYNKEAADELVRKGQRPSQLYNCCSGKHSGMLLLCRYHGFPTEGYTDPNHPVQQLIRAALAELLELPAGDIHTGVDGCKVPTFLVSVRQASLLYSLLAAGSTGRHRFAPALGRISKAMQSHPRMINGDREFCTDLIEHTQGRVIGKVGAEGVYCIAVPDRKLGICIKTADGNERAVYPVAVHLLRQLEVIGDSELDQLKVWAYPPVKNHKGETVGYTLPVFDLQGRSRFELQSGDELDEKTYMR